MRRHLIAASTAASLACALAPAAFAPAAFAQDAPGEKVNQLIIYGDDPCPPSAEGEITVCARKAESERYRIPEPLRQSSSPQNEAWTNKVIAYETVGDTGTRSCSPVGAGGWTGCADQLISNAYAEREQSSDVRFSELIAAEREKRLATIDEEAAATQARVEQAEREYEARRRAQAEAEADAPGFEGSPLPAPVEGGGAVNLDGSGRPGQ